jgi:DNA processing protein
MRRAHLSGTTLNFARPGTGCHRCTVDSRTARIALNMVEHVGPVRFRQLMTVFEDPADILKASRRQLMAVPGIGEETADAIVRWEQQVDLAGELRRIDQFQCHVVIPGDPEFPQALQEIYDPPLVLYVKGSLLPADRHGIAMVGSRLTTPYGVETARRLARQLAQAGLTVVSGGARGIDTAAHQGALHAGGRTLAVLGTGINLVFPPENAGLFQQISERGGLITQFPFNRPPDRQTFPIRNRIVAGMTLGTLVVEANLKSGALITAHFAAEYGRQVFAVPGRVDSPRSKGCHQLIKTGAKLCEGLEDVLSEFEYLFPPAPPRATRAPMTDPSSDSTVALPIQTSPETDSLRRAVPRLTDDEAQVWAALEEDMDQDTLVRVSNLPVRTVQIALTRLERKRLVQVLPGGLIGRQTQFRENGTEEAVR